MSVLSPDPAGHTMAVATTRRAPTSVSVPKDMAGTTENAQVNISQASFGVFYMCVEFKKWPCRLSMSLHYAYVPCGISEMSVSHVTIILGGKSNGKLIPLHLPE